MEGNDANSENIPWRGCSMQEIYRNLSEWELRNVPPVHPSDNHNVLYHFPIRNFNEPPKPLRQHEKWDSSHVRLSCSSQSRYPVTKSDGTVTIESRWDLIRSAFARPIRNSKELERAILSYNSKYSSNWKFWALHKLFEEESTEEEEKAFFENLLPKIISLALRLPELVAAPVPLLKQGQNRSLTMSQQQAACLLANAFLCTFPRRNTMNRKSEYSTFPNINFNRLFQSIEPQVIEKIKCICHYFRRVCNTEPIGVLTFSRRSLSEKDIPKWNEIDAPLGVTPLHVSSAGTIEDQGQGLLQVDFANKFLGGGVLGGGCVQEEIRFVICPELLVTKLFTEALKPNEALVMAGCEQYSKYTGYASTFTWAGDLSDLTPMDESRRRQCDIVAIDALHFVQTSHQYREELIIRELNKAYVGFMHTLDTPAPGVASGNWGCGAFGGDANLKALIQLIACTVAKRPLVYFTFGNIELRDAVHDIHTFFIENNVTVKQLWSYLKEFRSHKLAPGDLYGFICQMHCDKQHDQLKANSSLIQRLIASTKTLRLKTAQKRLNHSPNRPTIVPTRMKGNKDTKIVHEVMETVTVNLDDHEEKQVEQKRANISADLFSPDSSPICDTNKQDSSARGGKSIAGSPKKKPTEKQVEHNRANASADLFSPDSSPICDMNKQDSSACGGKSPAASLKKKPTESDAPTGSKLRQKSLLEMLDCFYNEKKNSSAKRLRISDDSDCKKNCTVLPTDIIHR